MGSSFINRSLVPILFVVMLGVALPTTVTFFYTKDTAEELALGQMSQALNLLNAQVSEKIRSVQANASFWAQEDVFRLALTEGYLGRSARVAANRRLAERMPFTSYDRAFLALPDGSVASASVAGVREAVNVADREYFKRSLLGHPAFEALQTGKFTGQPVLVVSAPVTTPERNVEGVMILVLDIHRLAREILDQVRIGQTGGAYILEPNGRMLAVPSWSQAGQFAPDPEVVAALREAAAGTKVTFEREGSPRLAVAAVNPVTGWLVAVEADGSEIMRPAAKLTALNGVISLAVLAVVSVALAYVRGAVARLRESEDRYRTLAETTPVGIATFDRQGRVLYMNQRAVELLELLPQKALEDDWSRRFVTREGQPLAPGDLPVLQVLSGGRPVMGRAVWYDKPSGGRAVLSVSVVPQDAGANAAGAVAVIEDVTERMRIQEIMVQTEKMLSVGGLAAGMAHEINNPLASILQALQVIIRRLDPDMPANARKAEELGLNLHALQAYMRERGLTGFLNGIHESGVRAARIVTNMLGFARKSGGDYGECRLDELLDKTVELAGGDYDLKKQYDFRQIEIERDYDPELGPVECQSMEIEQVFFNIIKNAAQALKEGGQGGDPPQQPRITLRTRREGGMAVAEIEDNGPGMSEEIRKRVFEPFYTTKSIGVGTGLGLSVAYFIISQNHRGSITVVSAPGAGATFRVLLPVKVVA
ncbi:MAG: ATP-binding protein [Acidobacteriota bacterium]